VIDGPDTPRRRTPPDILEWPDDELRHRIQLVVEVASGPGIEIVAAQLLLDAIETLTHEGLIPASVALRISSPLSRGR
jgi:hypothetical protein